MHKAISAVRAFLIAIGVVATAGAAHAQYLNANDQIAAQRCAGFMLMGPVYTGIKINGEGIDCPPMEVTKLYETAFRFKGRLVHAGKPIDYNVVITKNGVITEQSLQVEGDLPSSLSNHSKILFLQEFPGPGLAKTGWKGAAYTVISYAIANIQRSWRDIPATGQQTGTINYFTDQLGADYKSMKIEAGKKYGPVTVDAKFPNTFIDACQHSCNAESACKAWALTTALPRACYLKTAPGERIFHPSTISGLKLN